MSATHNIGITEARRRMQDGETLLDRDGDQWRFRNRRYELYVSGFCFWAEAHEPHESCAPFREVTHG